MNSGQAGIEINNIRFAMRIDQVKRGICIQPIVGALIAQIVVKKLIPVNVDDATNKI